MAFFRKTRITTFAGVPIPRPDPTCGDHRGRVFIEALRNSDWLTAEAVLDHLQDSYEREFFTALVGEVPGRPEGFDRWVEERPASPNAWLLRGAHSVSWAWEARGRDRAANVPDDAWPVFHERLRCAEEDLLRAVEFAPHDPVPWTHLLTTSRGLQLPQHELLSRFREGDRRCPQLIGLHRACLQGLCEKWGGSHEAMFDFARRTADTLPLGSPLHGLIIDAHIERAIAGKRFDMHWTRSETGDEVRAAAERSVFNPNWLDIPYTVPMLNTFAFGLSQACMSTEARQIGARIGPRRTRHPWDYYDRADSVFARVLPLPD